MKKVALAGALALALAAPATASAHSTSSWGWAVGFAETKLDRTYTGGPHDCVSYGRPVSRRFYKHFVCSDDEGTFILHVTGQHRMRVTGYEYS